MYVYVKYMLTLLLSYFVAIIRRWWITNTMVIDTVVSPSMDANIMIVTEWGESLSTWVPAPRISVLAEYTSFPTAKGLDSPKTYWIKENLFISRQLDINIGIMLSYMEIANYTHMLLSQLLIGCSLFSQDYCKVDWVIMYDNEKAMLLVDMSYRHWILPFME